MIQPRINIGQDLIQTGRQMAAIALNGLAQEAVGNGNQTNNNAINLNTPACSGTQDLLCAEQ